MNKTKTEKRERRKMHIRKTVSGSALKPRVFVFKSNKYFYAGVADDDKNVVIMSKMTPRKSEGIVKMAGEFAKGLKGKKIETVVFDRSGYKYHGLVASFVEELRNKGIKI
jgi:large subunit ribosomal protein L18